MRRGPRQALPLDGRPVVLGQLLDEMTVLLLEQLPAMAAPERRVAVEVVQLLQAGRRSARERTAARWRVTYQLDFSTSGNAPHTPGPGADGAGGPPPQLVTGER